MSDDTLDPAAATEAAHAFAIDGELTALERYERGHIHHTFISTWQPPEPSARPVRFLHQRMNETVFRDIDGLMHNIERVTGHLRHTGAGGAVETLRLVATRDGAAFLRQPSGAWRTYEFVENTHTVDRPDGPGRAFEAAHAFGTFQARLADLDPAALRETIPGYFSAPLRLRQLEDALGRDVRGRAARAAAEIALAQERRGMVEVPDERMAAGAFPARIVHGDTKLNNVLFDSDTGAARCIVDLDTCMPAYSLYDFGDLVRFTAATCAEDEPDASAAGVDLELYRALADGYLESTQAFLRPAEIELMPFAARLVTYLIGIRFLADFLAGDPYFRTARPEHNLDRARVQLRMVVAMEQQEAAMRRR